MQVIVDTLKEATMEIREEWRQRLQEIKQDLEEDRESGKVIVFKDAGYGFLSRDSDGTSVFFHFSALPGDANSFKTIEAGEKVTFQQVETTKGPRAEFITITGGD